MQDKIYITDKQGKRRRAEKVVCENCHKEFIRRIFVGRKNKFCSQKCSYEFKTTKKCLICIQCGSEFERNICKIKKINFCSRSCKEKYQSGENHPSWNGGQSSYRERCRRRDDYKCCMGDKCELKGIKLPRYMYDVDHIDGNRKNNSITNLRTMCVWCHRKKHRALSDNGNTPLLQSGKDGSVPSEST